MGRPVYSPGPVRPAALVYDHQSGGPVRPAALVYDCVSMQKSFFCRKSPPKPSATGLFKDVTLASTCVGVGFRVRKTLRADVAGSLVCSWVHTYVTHNLFDNQSSKALQAYVCSWVRTYVTQTLRTLRARGRSRRARRVCAPRARSHASDVEIVAL